MGQHWRIQLRIRGQVRKRRTMVLAQTNLEWAAPVIQLVTSGGFGALAWYLIVKHGPRVDEMHRVERKEAQDQFILALESQRSEFEKSIHSEREHCRELLNHITDRFLELPPPTAFFCHASPLLFASQESPPLILWTFR